MREDAIIEINGKKCFSLKKLLGQGYTDAWFSNCHARYRLFCGSRSSKKSFNIIGYEPIFKILSDSRRNVLIARQNDSDNRQSTFENICGRIIDLGLEKAFKISKNPLTIEYTPTGQQIIFRGLNNPTSLNGITFAHGYFTDAYIEEAFEVPTYDDFRKLDGSIRGQLPQGLFFQITMCFNAWDGDCWIKREFFDGIMEDNIALLDDPKTLYVDHYDPNWIGPYGKGLYLHKSTYKINEFRSPDYDLAAEEMKKKSPKTYIVEFLGGWGALGDIVYPSFDDGAIVPLNALVGRTDQNFPVMTFSNFSIGIDTGYSNGAGSKIKIKKGDDPNAKVRSATTMTLNAVTADNQKMVTIAEYYHSNIASATQFNTDDKEILTMPEQCDRLLQYIARWINRFGGSDNGLMNGQINVYVDSADLGTRTSLEIKAREYGLFNLRFIPSTKISIQSRIDFWNLMFDYGDYLISDTCKNLIREIKNARRGKKGEARSDTDDHVLTATEYGLQPIVSNLTRWKTFKIH